METTTTSVGLKNPVIELKNVKHFQGRDGYGLNATLYLNGKKIAFVLDEGCGGEMTFDADGKDIEQIKENRLLIEQLRDYAKGLPPVDVSKTLTGLREDEKFMEMDLPMLIDELLNEEEKKKANKRMEKQLEKRMLTAICYGIKGGSEYRYATFKHPLAVIKEKAPQVLQKHVEAIRAKLKEGEVIFNTNI